MCYFQEPDDVVNNALVRRDQGSRQHGRSAALQTRNRVAGRTNQLQFFPTLCNHHGMKRLLPVLMGKKSLELGKVLNQKLGIKYFYR